MRLRDLGTLSIEIDGAERSPGGARPGAVLALLLVHANERVSVEACIEAVWGSQASRSAASTLESHIWRLRRVLEPGRGPREAPSVLVNQAGGYRLFVSAHEVDSLRFSQFADDVAELMLTGQAPRALKRCDDALRLWRGRPYGQFADEEWVAAAAARLEEQRRQIQERRIDALLASGMVEQAVLDVEPLIRQMPFRERFRVQQMLALYRAGRADDALRAFHDARTTMLDEIGLEPGPDLQYLQRRILDRDPSLGSAAPPVRAHSPVEVRLPSRTSPIIGRDGELAVLEDLLQRHRLLSLAGPAGVGKTRLGVELAGSAAGRFPDGVWFADLTPLSDPGLLVTTLMSAIGLQPPATGRAVAALQAHVRDRRMLLVLDNCEHLLPELGELVSELVGPDAEITIVATTREPLGIAGETVYVVGPLALYGDADTETATDGGSDGTVDAHNEPAVELFLARARDAAKERVEALAPADALRAARRICAAVDGLPLALELAAARAHAYSLDEIAEQVDADPSRLTRLERGGAGHRRSLRAALEWSERLLDGPSRHLHRGLSVLPGAFTLGAAEAVSGDWRRDGGDVADLLPLLVNRSLLTVVPPSRSGGPSRFRQLAIVRSHASRALGPDDTEQSLRRRDAWVAALMDRRPSFGSFDEAAWFDAIDDDGAAVQAMLARTLGAGAVPEPADRAAGMYAAHRLSMYWYYRSRMAEAGQWLSHAVQHAEAGDVPVEARCFVLLSMAAVSALRGRSDLARHDAERALELADHLGPQHRIEAGSQLARAATAVWSTDDLDLMTAINVRLRLIAAEARDPNLDVFSDSIECLLMIRETDSRTSARRAEEVYERAVGLGHAFAAWTAAGARTVVALMQREPGEGMRWSDRVIDIHRRLGTRQGGWYLETRANFACLAGDHVQAAGLYAAARTHNRRGGIAWPRRAVTHELQALTRSQLGESAFAAAWRVGERWSLADIVALGPGSGVG